MGMLLVVTFASCEDEDDDLSTSLVGKWIWQSSCGGFVGCVYPTGSNHKILRITEDLLELNEAGKITLSDSYVVRSVDGDDQRKTYEIEFTDGSVWNGTIEHNLLTVTYSVMTVIYKRETD